MRRASTQLAAADAAFGCARSQRPIGHINGRLLVADFLSDFSNFCSPVRARSRLERRQARAIVRRYARRVVITRRRTRAGRRRRRRRRRRRKTSNGAQMRRARARSMPRSSGRHVAALASPRLMLAVDERQQN